MRNPGREMPPRVQWFIGRVGASSDVSELPGSAPEREESRQRLDSSHMDHTWIVGRGLVPR